MAAPTFVSLEVLKDELGITQTPDPDPTPAVTAIDDGILMRLLASTTRRGQEKAGRSIFSGNKTFRMSGAFRSEIWVPDTPITAVNSLKDGLAVITPSEDGSQWGYQFDDEHLWLTSGNFSRGHNNVVLDFVGGFAVDVIPDDIIQATIRQCQYQWSRRSNIAERSKNVGAGQVVSWERDALIPFFVEVFESYQSKTWQS